MTLDPAVDAIRSLTDAARQTRLRDGVREPVDFAELTAGVLAGVAANVGGTDALLAGRPGSWEADLVRQLIEGTAPTARSQDYAVEDGPHGRHWVELLAAPRHRPDALLADSNVVPKSPGVYAWFRDDEPVYAGRAASSGGLRSRLSKHLGTGTDLSHSTFRAWVAVAELGVDRKTARARPPFLTEAQVDVVTEWIRDCEVAWIACETVAAAKRFERGLLYAWEPPLNDD